MKQGPLFSALILLSVTAHLCAAESPFYVSLTAQLSFAEGSGIVNDTAVPPAFATNLRHFVADTANARCQQQCQVEGGNVTLDSMVSRGDYVFDVSLRIYTDDAATSLKIAAGGVFLPESVFKSWDQETVVDLSTAFLTTSQQTLGVVEGVVLPTGHLRRWRGVWSGRVRRFQHGVGRRLFGRLQARGGVDVQRRLPHGGCPECARRQVFVGHGKRLDDLHCDHAAESCPVSDLCRQGDLWQPDLWLDKYGEGVNISNLPAPGLLLHRHVCRVSDPDWLADEHDCL